MRGDVVMRQHNMHLFYVVSGVERCVDSTESAHLSCFQEACSSSAIQKIPRLKWNSKPQHSS
jgi:hypothetical protein